MNTSEKKHRELIVEQFSSQAVPFANVPGHMSAMETLLAMAGPRCDDEVLDVACGPGLVACEFARHVRLVEGIDITPAMIGEARKRQTGFGMENLSWRIGAADPLPYDDGRFSLVITRYSFHHFTDARRVLDEMIRVCRSGGRVVIADVVLPESKAGMFDSMERMRDPSHTQALRVGMMEAWFREAGLVQCRSAQYSVDVELEAQLRASFPEPGDDEKLREMITADAGVDVLGIDVRQVDGSIWFSYPITVMAATKP